MKKYLFILAAAATCLLAACNKNIEQDVPEVEDETPAEIVHNPDWTYIRAEGGEGTKARIDGNTAAFTWTTDDQIAVFSGNTYYKSNGLEGRYNFTNDAEFVFEDAIDAGRADFAVYPASLVFNGDNAITNCVTNHSASNLTINLPASYTLNDVKDNKAQTPMIAVNEPGEGLAFKSICALVRITVKVIAKDANTIKVTFPGKKIQGEFTLSGVDLSNLNSFTGVQTSSTAGSDDTITITDLGISSYTSQLTINVPIPAGVASSGEYLYVRVGVYDSTDHKINSIDTPLKVVSSVPTAWVPSRKASRKVTVNLPYFTSNGKTYRKVVLAPGNLVATLTKKAPSDTDPLGEATNFRFAEHQYDALGDCAANRLAALGDFDLFAWVGASATYAYPADSYSKYGIIYTVSSRDAYLGNGASEKIKYNWADIFNGVTYPAGTWRLPNNEREGGDSANEWNRIGNSRTPEGGGNSYVSAKATIKDGDNVIARGLIVFPNNYTHPYGVKALVNYTRNAMPASHWADNVITLEEWNLLENVGGCAFLPVTSARSRNNGSNTAYYYGDAAYWSDYSLSAQHSAAMVTNDVNYSTVSLTSTSLTASTFTGAKSCDRRNGCAVRLIRDLD